jgi:hypothetical protein
VRACVHRGECSYMYEYLRLYCVSQKKSSKIQLPCNKQVSVPVKHMLPPSPTKGKKISRLSYLQLYNIEGIMSIPVLGSKIGKKHSSIILKAIINFMLHSAMRAISAAAQTF